jgi:G3E family GTPase
MGYQLQSQDTRILAMRTGCMECTIREAIQFKLYPDNMNKEEGLSLSN